MGVVGCPLSLATQFSMIGLRLMDTPPDAGALLKLGGAIVTILGVPIGHLYRSIRDLRKENRSLQSNLNLAVQELAQQTRAEDDRLHARVNEVRQGAHENHVAVIENFATKSELNQQLDDVKALVRAGREESIASIKELRAENNENIRELVRGSEQRHEALMAQMRRFDDKLDGKQDKHS